MSRSGVPQLICHVGPITALTVCANKVLWGCGSEIYVFDVTVNKLETRRQILVGASVHGIKTGPTDGNNHLLCVYGGKQARVVSVEVTKSADIIVLSDIMTFMDWIWDVHWLINELESGRIAVALAHNSVVRWDWQPGTVSSQRDCVEKCILYCAHLIGRTWDNLMLAAGTVFNQIVLWPVACNSQAADEPVDVMHTFIGHQGVIFSIRYHTDLQRLCSVSDDRSIRMWQLTFPDGKLSEPNPEDWRCVKSDLCLLLYGHSARVWDVALTSTYFASVGEDAVCCIWNYSGNIIHKFEGHKGRSIWRLATSKDEKFVLTGGGDGSIRMWEIHQEKARKMFQRIVSVPQSTGSNQDYFPRTVKMMNFDLILIMMNTGDLYLYSVNDQRFSLLVSDSKFRSYSIVSPCPDQKTLALGGISGIVRIIQLPEVQDDEIKFIEMSLFSGKVLALTWLDKHNFLVSGPDGLCLLQNMEEVQDTDTDDATLSIKMQYQLAIPASKHRWITAACFVPAGDEDFTTSHSVIVCGDKDGSVYSYSLAVENISNSEPALKILQPSKSFYRVHGKAGVTFVCYRDGIIYTSGRDGFYRQWKMKAGDLSQLHGNKIVKGFEWIDRLEWYKDDLLVYGFFSSMFVVWSVSFSQQLMSVNCGGGHRAWGCCHDNDTLRFAYLKAGQVYVVDSGHQTKQIILQPELHGRKIWDVKFMTVLSNEKDKLIHIVCSASEDTTITIGSFKDTSNLSSWRPITTLKGHMSSVRALTLSSHSIIKECKYAKAHLNDLQTSEKYSSSSPHSGDHFILFSGGGRAEIRVWKLNIVTDNLYPESSVHTRNSINQNEIKFTCDNVQNLHLDDPQDYLALDDSREDLTAPSQNSISGVNSGETAESYAPERSTPDSLYQIQCNYQHLSTHFLGQPHKRKSQKLRLDPDTRIMSLDASSLADLSNGYWDSKELLPEDIQHLSRVHILSCAGSDGVFRVFVFDEQSRAFSSLADSTYHQGCVLTVLHYVHHSDLKRQSFAVSASTNGNIVFWSLDPFVKKLVSNILSKKQSKASKNCSMGSSSIHECDESDESGDTQEMNPKEGRDWKPVSSVEAHQSGVNSLHVLQVSESQLLLASGGDDNALTVQLLEFSDSGMKVMAKVTKEDAHAAQVTGIHVVSSKLVVSTSIDQRVCVWSIKQAPDIQMQLQMVACRYISVADISSISVYLYKNSVYLSIGGEGLCLYRLTIADGMSQ